MTEEQTMRELLCECLRFIERKIEDGKVTINDIRTMTETLCSTLGIDATIKDIANFYDTSEINVRSLIKRRILGKPKRRVYYDFREIAEKVPAKWHGKHSRTDD